MTEIPIHKPKTDTQTQALQERDRNKMNQIEKQTNKSIRSTALKAGTCGPR